MVESLNVSTIHPGLQGSGVLTIEGQKMSKSKGNFLTLRDAINRFSADVV
ncbi:class I tRNA ligase family protein, partial [Candidatus Bathyarchaeota archaeon]|nr:class I tRNA ligase family protein [Candidatus Bathyarchaeota archaeon]